MSEWERSEDTSPVRTLLGLALGFLGLPLLHLVMYGGGYGLLVLVNQLSGWRLNSLWTPYYVGLLGIGVTQLLYVVPLLTLALLFKQRAVAAGLLISACLTFLLNGACFGYVFFIAGLDIH